MSREEPSLSVIEGARPPCAAVEEALEDVRAGKMVVVCDDEDRENEGALTMAAQFATPGAKNIMARDGRGAGLPRANRGAL